jgi:hypothetical protein
MRGLSENACRSAIFGATLVSSAILSPGYAGADEGLVNRTIGYVMTNKVWAVYQTADGKAECPDGLNDGPREQFKLLFPDDGKKRSLAETALAREAEVWFPSEQEPLPFHDAVGKIGVGLNLDGKTGPNDFTSPDGETGIDNQMYRAIGCIPGYRGPDGAIRHFENEYMQQQNFNRILLEITDVDDLSNDDDVTVTTYRGIDELLTAATGKEFIAGGTQRVDEKWGRGYVQHFKGKIANGVLTTDTADVKFPGAVAFNVNPDQTIKAARFRLRLMPGSAEGMIGGYVDVEDWHQRFTRAWSTHHASYGQVSVPSLYRALKRLADAYPDPTTGKNTAVSAAAQVKFVQAFLLHSAPKQIQQPSVGAAK